jgi:acyl-CoA thioester hydrolase
MIRALPETRDRFKHFLTITTRWMYNDVYRHVNNVVYYSFFDTAVNECMIRHGLLDLDHSPVVSLVVDTGCSYFRPVAFPDTVHCGLRVEELRRSSVRYEIGVFRNDEDRASAQGHFVHVTCDRATHRPVSIPDAMRRVLESLRLAG